MKKSQTGIFFMCFVVIGLGNAILGPALPSLAEQTQSSLSDVSIFFTVRALGFLGGALLAGYLWDHFSQKLLIGIFLLAYVVSTVLIPSVPYLWVLIVVMVILGISEAGVDVGGNTSMIWIHGEKSGPYMNAMHFFFGVGAFLSPLFLGQALEKTGSIDWAFWLIPLFVIPPFLLNFTLPGLPPPSQDEKEEEEGNPLLIVVFALFFFIYVGLELGFAGWIYTYALHYKIMDESTSAYLTSSFWGALTCGRLITVLLTRYLSSVKILVGNFIGSALAIGALLIWPTSLISVWGSTIALGLSLSSIFPTSFLLLESRITISAKVTSWGFAGASLGAMFLPWLIGQFIEERGPGIMTQFIAVDLVLCVIVFLIFLRIPSKKGKLLPA